MTKSQRNKIIRIIKKDSTLFGRYVGRPRSGDACVIGGLALACGVRRGFLLRINKKPISQALSLCLRLAKAYGLNRSQLCRLQDVNDTLRSLGTKECETKERRVQLVALVKSKIFSELTA